MRCVCLCCFFFTFAHSQNTSNELNFSSIRISYLFVFYAVVCIELSSNLNLKSNCQYKIRCQSHFYLFFGDEQPLLFFFSLSLSILIHIMFAERHKPYKPINHDFYLPLTQNCKIKRNENCHSIIKNTHIFSELNSTCSRRQLKHI